MLIKKILLSLMVLAFAVANPAAAYGTKHSLEKYVENEFHQLATPSAQTKQFAAGTSYTLCFVPDGPGCERLLVDAINGTKQSLLIQAYSFTSPPIAEAVVNAHKRGVDVRVIVDKSQVSEKYTSATFLKHAGVPVVVDTKPAIAHNKVMVFDQQAVFTGSFNFTRSAQDRNAKNGMIIRGDMALVNAYTDNWATRFKQSSAY